MALVPDSMLQQLRMPLGGAFSLYGQCTIAFIMVFAWMYWRASINPTAYRPFVEAGVVGKLAIVTLVLWHWVLGVIGPTMPVLVLGDLGFAIAFLRYLAAGETIHPKTINTNWAAQPK